MSLGNISGNDAIYIRGIREVGMVIARATG
jgi:hypothetical protein